MVIVRSAEAKARLQPHIYEMNRPKVESAPAVAILAADHDFHENIPKLFPFRPEMKVHGRFKQPCPDCGAPVQRIRYAENETNYCARCQTGGRLLADRAMSRLLKEDWPRSLDELG